MILITGATGTVGSGVVRLLAARGERIRALTREPARASVPAGVQVVRGDFGDRDSLETAADGVTALFLLSAPGPSLAAHDLAMLAAARTAGVRRVVKLSAIGTGEGRVGSWHLPGERAVRESGLEWTLLRPSAFASNTLGWAAQIRTGEPVPNLMGTGAQGVIDPRDVAEVAVRALTTADLTGEVRTLTGPEPLSVPDQAARLEKVLGRTVTCVDVPLDTARRQMLAAGTDPAFADVVIDGAGYVHAGRNATITDDVEWILGRPPGNFDAWARDHRAAFG